MLAHTSATSLRVRLTRLTGILRGAEDLYPHSSSLQSHDFLHFSSLGLPIQPPRWYSQPICLAKQSGIPASDAASGKNSKKSRSSGDQATITSNSNNTHLMILRRATAGLTDTPTHLYLAVLFFMQTHSCIL